ncbi:PRP1 splicing factor, N-terminal-domain-containing protein [Entophlyctis helioformis]|nr:PRP1 splicing factor, N-terminal-domain-containing protein [Entophlyctis helioformis]
MSKPAPPNYIAGLGRGASGFTTRSDIGPARESADDGAAALAAAQAATEGRGPRGRDGNGDGDDGDAARYQDPDNEMGLFNTAPYEADDEEADRIYAEVEARMDERRKSRREAREQEELEKYRRDRPNIQQQFADLKRDLSSLSQDDWAAIPEVGDLVRKKGKKVKTMSDRQTAVPDSILLGAASRLQSANSVDSSVSAADPSGTMTDFAQFGQARDKVLGLKLDQISDSVSGQTTIDPKGYLTDLSSVVVKSDSEISDIKKARMLLRSVTTTNPKHAPGWIAAARLEEVAGKIAAAREILSKGCEECPKSEDIWLEAVRINTKENAKIILGNAVRQLPHSVKIWLRARDLETEVRAQKLVLRRAIESIPNSVKLWKAAVSLEEDPDDARTLLSRAVECVPLSVELWIALARLESYENARKVLNKARQSIPTSHEIWVSAAKLEEHNKNTPMVGKVIDRSIAKLMSVGSNLEREQWLAEAEAAEKEGFVAVAQAIVKATIGMGIEDEDRKATWMEDAEACITRSSIETAPFLEKEHGTPAALEELLARAVRYCPQAEVLWLMGAKEKWIAGDVEAARGILEQAFLANPDSEQIWLAAIKLEVETGEHERARVLLGDARKSANTERVWMKGLKQFPAFDKLWMIKGQILHADQGNIAAAREAYAQGLKRAPKSVPLWLLASRLEEDAGLPVKARATLERARLLNPNVPELWCEALWSQMIATEARPQRRARSVDALKKCENDPVVVTTVAQLFWAERKLDKARSWFNRAIKTNPDLGDTWGWLLKFEKMHGTAEQVDDVVQRCVAAEPRHGEVWQSVSKSMRHVGAKTDEILSLVAARLESIF